MVLAAVLPVNVYSVKEVSFDKDAKKVTRNRIRDDGDGPDDCDDDDGRDDNYDSTTRASKTHGCTSSSSFPTDAISPLWLTAAASSSTPAEETPTATVEITTDPFTYNSHTKDSASSTLFLLPTSVGLASNPANPTTTIVGKRPVQTTVAFIIVPISITIIVLLLSLVGYLVFRIRGYRRDRDAGKTFSGDESRSNRQSSVFELDTRPDTQQRRTWYSRLRESFITPKVPVQNRTSHVYRVPDYDRYINWAHRSSSAYSAATMSDISSGYGTYGSQHALPIGSLGVRPEPTKSSMVY